ncbi:cell division protein FtsJ [Paenibacillus albiflavus]|uniref:Cell division protein FtsJ n=1 Tax=Paenibacillus albiflavus TaxID=2545760 RepID=A0A4R4ELA8_9BACL|nr:cyclic-phosphate processing receiver domain-containing protein [Paenibacillus albiflavus]TCZ81034.1 cell division protein FtsJ [Paenibacillus albiflavus]
MIHVYLDDSRRCPEGFVLAKTAAECILILDEYEVDILSLDYDLGWNCPTGSEVARWIAASGKYPRKIYLHTSSYSGRVSMYETLYSCKPDEVKLYNGPMPDDILAAVAKEG